MKILHLANDDKFLDLALPLFNSIKPSINETYVFAKSGNLKRVKLRPSRVVIDHYPFLRRAKLKPRDYEGYDLVVFHSFGDDLYPEISKIPKNTPTVWLGWGYDYYEYLGSDDLFVLNKTRSVTRNVPSIYVISRLKKLFKSLLVKVYISKSKTKSIEQLTVFSPVIESEFESIKSKRIWKGFPEYVAWNYGNLEESFIKGVEGKSIHSDNIMIGNSGTATNNHFEIVDLLSDVDITGRKVVVPLSYGDRNYSTAVSLYCGRHLTADVVILEDFLPLEKYVECLRGCGYVIMNHIRQQALGNIITALYLGARVFLRSESPLYSFLKDLGVHLSSVQELETDVMLLNTPLSEQQRYVNRYVVSSYWSKTAAIRRTKFLIEKATGRSL
ncbi:TDP-N-acetylfucosamine:lipid II N-acetylfucosaminyltransferase [Thalassolituus sp.]|uniref:TDP-N-acetylfucosamine:lipid II N-acetylfucosaminyltransferase n=1 Tax=Thalassolituus sp. TaxID=2030822 RepID=UPI00261FB4C2|nr:TDP-N-acetylfucosamine:lipid II N-acetylfucosaminyltransferase [Thalassolituus sp.]MDQ4426452.1 TDP-N-acetylfucosamine:lipid II N-acetylfucosaminyltransferase [Thalassolituus sp.]